MLTLLVGLVALALLPAAAHAHRLTAGKAQNAAKAVALDVADALDGQTLEDGVVINVEEVAAGACKRRSVHRFDCLIGHRGTFTSAYDGEVLADWACVARVSVSYRNRRSRRLRLRLGEPECDGAPREVASATSRRRGGSVEAMTRGLEGSLR